jgi:putative SOS response-associated peptidase YedK
MCGRFVSPDEAAVERAFHLGRGNWKAPFGKPRYNVAPTMRVIMLRRSAGSGIELAHARWGFIPYWWKEGKPPSGRFNAKSETAGANGMWREAFSRARCLVPALGWYEWRKEERMDRATGEVVKVNQPYYILRRDRGLVCFAGLMSRWKESGEHDPTLTCAILTCAAAGPLAEIHERMPVVLPKDVHVQWLDPALTDPAAASALVERRVQADFELRRVGLAINRTEEDSERLIEPLETG